VLTIAVTAFCLSSTYPLLDQKRPDGTVIAPKIHLVLTFGAHFLLVRLEPAASPDGSKRSITKSMVEQAMEAIRSV
jgi:hypothetical protein